MQSSSNGLVNTLREVATTERLRSDHIMTLELMQETVDENAALKDINKKLMKRLSRLGDDGSAPDNEEPDQIADNSSAGASAMTKKLLKQEEELVALRTENKLLKGQAKQDERRIKELQRSNNSNDALRRELDAFKAEASKVEDDAGVDVAEAAELRLQVNQLQEQLMVAEVQMKSLSSDSSSRVQKLEASLLSANANVDTLTTEKVTLQEQLQEANGRIYLLTAEIGDKSTVHSILEAKYNELRKVSDQSERALRDKLHEAELKRLQYASEVETHRQLVLSTEEELKRIKAMNSNLERQVAELLARPRVPGNPLLLPSESEGSFFLTGNEIAAPSVTPAPAPAPVRATSVEEGDMSFDEFVRLRKEVKSLKQQLMQLVQPGKGKNKSRQGGVPSIFGGGP